MIVGGVPMLFGGFGAPPSNTYDTWNPNDKNANVVLTDGNLSAASSDSGRWVTVRATVGKTSGKWYWEVRAINTYYVVNPGVALIGNSLSDRPLCSYQSNGVILYGSTWSAAVVENNDVVGIALDMDAGTLRFYKNNVPQAELLTGLVGPCYPSISLLYDSGAPSKVTANFGATALVYAPPSGFNAGVYT